MKDLDVKTLFLENLPYKGTVVTKMANYLATYTLFQLSSEWWFLAKYPVT